MKATTTYYQSVKPIKAQPTNKDLLKAVTYIASILAISIVLFTKAIPTLLELIK